MRRKNSLGALFLPIIGIGILTGCTLTRQDAEPIVVTATLPADQGLPLQSPIPTYTPLVAPTNTTAYTAVAPPTIPGATASLHPTDSFTESPTAAAPTIAPTGVPTDVPTIAPPPTFTVPPPPTRTSALPPEAIPLDDGSGNPVIGTGDNPAVLSPVPDVEALPEPLYYLSDQGGVTQVWRLRYGINHPDQLTFDPAGVVAFDVAPNGTLAYITPDGLLSIDGIFFNPPTAPDNHLPRLTSIAWSPTGDWLAYTLSTPGAREAGSTHPIDGLWIRNNAGRTVHLQATTYSPGDDLRIFTGPLTWYPDGSEILTGLELAGGHTAARVEISTGNMTPLWDTGALPPGTYGEVQWSVNANALISSDAEQVLRVEPDTLEVEVLVDADAGLWMENAQQFANGALTFVGSPLNPSPSGPATGPKRLYLIPPERQAPTYITESLTDQGTVDFLWDTLGQQTLIVVYEPAAPTLGTPFLRDRDGTLHDLTALTGLVGSPRWGPVFQGGDAGLIQTTSGDTLNLRAAPNGDVLVRLASGIRITVIGGPRVAAGYRWWQVRTTDGVTGWAAESVVDVRGMRLRTLIPAD